MLIKYQRKIYDLCVLTRMLEDVPEDLNDPMLGSWRNKHYDRGMYRYTYYHQDSWMLKVAVVSETDPFDEEFLNKIVEAIIVLK